ncbi:dystrophin-like isoform X2 [Condylostylus longicornis]|uniref:dystrophin-like isoform X2 n=1 Tax=Condylostylus longicornis TaxID=2530218 RepID=UPI00244E42C6|nr:dystrophin-like isoform X2 [Condylostylus longicornis]
MSQSNQQSVANATNSEKSSDICPEIPKITSELAAQAALRAKQMQHKPLNPPPPPVPLHHYTHNNTTELKKVPDIPARSDNHHRIPPEIPPKRSSLKTKTITDQPVSQQAQIQNQPQPIQQQQQQPQQIQHHQQQLPIQQSHSQASTQQIVPPAPTRAPPPLPQKPSSASSTTSSSATGSAQNSPQLVPKFKERPHSGIGTPLSQLPAALIAYQQQQQQHQQQSTHPQRPISAVGSLTPQMLHKFQQQAQQQQENKILQGSPQPIQKFPSDKITSSPQFGIRNVNSPQLNVRSSPATATNSPQVNKKIPTKVISPTEDFGSEDALRGIESGLRNMERAMQEQMNLRSMEAAAAAAANQKLLQDNIKFSIGRQLENQNPAMRLNNPNQTGKSNLNDINNQNTEQQNQFNPTRGLERNLSMDQMRLDNIAMLNATNALNAPVSNIRSMESNPNIRSAFEEIKFRHQKQQQQQQQSDHSGISTGSGSSSGSNISGNALTNNNSGIINKRGPVEHHMRSLDRNLPLELQYSRHRSIQMQQDFSISGPAPTNIAELREHIRQQLIGGSSATGFLPTSPAAAALIQHQQQQQQQHQQQQQQQQQQNLSGIIGRQSAGIGGGISREDLRMRRRSSHDETQLSQQQQGIPVTRLREHWDETSSCVLQRASQLKNMLGDSQRYESKRLEIETWLSRMENRCERMGSVATTADVLEAQQKEQKSFHAELHQYKHHIELFNALTQKLIAVYPTDDTSRIKRMTEAVNQRYNNLNNAVINRGKLLHAAVHNLQSFDRSMDQFLAFLSEAESLCENAEAEIDRNPMVLKVRKSFL